MIGVTIFGLFLTPVFYVLLRSGMTSTIRKGGDTGFLSQQMRSVCAEIMLK